MSSGQCQSEAGVWKRQVLGTTPESGRERVSPPYPRNSTTDDHQLPSSDHAAADSSGQVAAGIRRRSAPTQSVDLDSRGGWFDSTRGSRTPRSEPSPLSR